MASSRDGGSAKNATVSTARSAEQEAASGPLRVMTTHLEYYSCPQREAQIDAIIQRTARLFQKRPEELGAVSIQQIGAREFQLGPSDIEQVVDALGEYKRAAAQRGGGA